jgi:GNAT superfamily N-acetyltransferase
MRATEFTSPASRTDRAWLVRSAETGDSNAIAAAVAALLVELGATPPPAQAMQDAARELLEDPAAGAAFVAEQDGTLVGVLTASWLSAIHIPGRYGLIQDLWVQPSLRSHALGGALLSALFARARDLGLARLEVGLPKDSFPDLEMTQSFYRANGFTALGSRMRMVLT